MFYCFFFEQINRRHLFNIEEKKRNYDKNNTTMMNMSRKMNMEKKQSDETESRGEDYKEHGGIFYSA